MKPRDAPKPGDRYRLRFRELLHTADVSQSKLCDRLTKRTGMLWRESRLSKMLNGHIAMELDDLVVMAEEAGISLVELFRVPGREFVADMTPSELKLIHAVRDYPTVLRHVTDIIDVLVVARRPTRAIVRERIRLGRKDD